MTSDSIKSFLKNINIKVSGTETGFIQIPELKAVTTINNGEQFINYHVDMINFDFENELLKIKEYNCRFVSEELKFKGVLENKALIGYKRINRVSIEPGDFIYFVNADSKTNIEKVYTIKSVSYEYIELETEVELPTQNVLMFIVHKDDLATSQVDALDIRKRYIMTPVSKYTADIYIGFDGIQGFRF